METRANAIINLLFIYWTLWHRKELLFATLTGEGYRSPGVDRRQ
jgi:hypothetical protein